MNCGQPLRARPPSNRVLLALLLALLAGALLYGVDQAQAQAGGVVYVNRSATGANNGTSWADAYTDLQTALANTTSGEIWVAQGTYTPAPAGGSREASFVLPSGVALYGGFVGAETARDQRDQAAHPTILSGDLNGDDLPNWGNPYDNSYRVVAAINTAAGTTLDGFVVRDGYAAGGVLPFGYGYGAGIFVQNGSLTLANCQVLDNLAIYSGAGAFITNGTVAISACEFRGNEAWHSHGGGLVSEQGSATTVADALFVENRSVGCSSNLSGGAIYNDFTSTLEVSRSTFVSNAAEYSGGCSLMAAVGGAIMSGASATIDRSLFVGNRAHQGGALLLAGNATVTNSVFSGNRAFSAATPYVTGVGGALELWHDPGELIELKAVTLANNMATNDAGGVDSSSGGGLLIENSVLWGNTSSNGDLSVFQAQIHGDADLQYDDIQGLMVGIPGEDPPTCTACLDADPLFINALGPDATVGTQDDNLRLGFGSPAVDAGANAGCPAADLDGLPRLTDGNGDAAATCDMGAYEAGTMLCAAPYVFGQQSGVEVQVTTAGTLACVYVDEMGLNHPSATAALQTGRYWLIRGLQADRTTNAGSFTVNLTLPTSFTPDASDQVCRYTGSAWDCAASAFNATAHTITRNNVTAFSDWAASNNTPLGSITYITIVVLNPSQVEVSWSPVAGATAYEVWYADNAPHFAPGTSCASPAPYQCAVTTTTSFVHTTLGDPAHNTTYRVIATDGAAFSAPSQPPVGEFEFALTPGVAAH